MKKITITSFRHYHYHWNLFLADCMGCLGASASTGRRYLLYQIACASFFNHIDYVTMEAGVPDIANTQ
jgi:hypothetical protein